MSCSSQEDYKEQFPTALEAAVGKAPSEDALDFEERFAAIDRKRLMRRVDLRIIPYICLTYMVVRLDLGNVANSGTMNSEAGHSLKQVLSLDAKQWAWVISCFYYPYMFSEPVCTFFVKLTSPSVWLTRIMVSWGAVMACMAAVTNYGGLVTCRVLLGLFEGSYFTSVIYHWSFWYTPDEMAPRVLFLYVANSSSGGFSGLFAYAVSFADGATLYGWQVLFIVEGLLTVTLGIGMYFILPDWPSTSKWLSPLEQEYIVAHRHRNAPKTTDKTWVTSEILLMFADPTFWFFSLFWACYAVGAWGISTVLPFVVLDLGISDSAGTQLLQIPPAATGVLMCCLSAYLIRKRNVSAFLCTLGLVGGVIVALVILITVEPAGVRYAACCVISGAAPSAYACLWPRRVAALRGSSAAALGIGINNAISQLSGLVGPSLWRSDYGPRYINSAKGACGLVAADFCIVLALWWLMEGDLTRFPWLKRRVLAQTQVSEADVEAEKRGETIARGRA
ncbi:uncharacterized protein JCM10292_007055 [Rhodotorula paludigena]|uniref:uncharacterized protein n=1 Tax=Rhodotorula paludigena TaxID=86838 RepID=UPI00316B49B1